ncbi:MAG: sigma-70 family RNA polymerase sigma factor [Proteobacteria bacterium]|nr:sigma-70 family RNA polymerase sigma factor [Pseudomonadota bacterium]
MNDRHDHDDQELAKKVLQGNQTAARTLVSRHHDAVFGLALRMLRNREDAAEVAQDAMVKALSNMHRYDPTRPFGPWINRIARNLCIDRYRRRKPTSELNEQITANPETKGRAYSRRADEIAHENHLMSAVEEAMTTLGPKYQEIIKLYHYDHMTYREIAAHLELPDGTVMNRLFRARKKLQAALLERGIRP